MALRKIATIGHPILRARARELTRAELAGAPMQQLVDDMVATMRDIPAPEMLGSRFTSRFASASSKWRTIHAISAKPIGL